jgi:endonuclease YncB( thermonuclease family)
MRGQALAVGILLAAPAVAEPLPPGLAFGETAAVREALDGDTVRLADGRELRLAAIAAPKAPLPRRGTEPGRDIRLEALAKAARQAVAEWTREDPVELYFATQQGDRHGRLVAHLVTPTKGWIQAGLVAEGLARVQTTQATATGAAALLRIEAAARAERRGMWAHPLFQVRTAEDSGRWLDTFQLVEGPVTSVRNGRTSSRIEIGAGERHLTVIVPAKTRAELRAAGVDLPGLLGSSLRVRGWIRWQDGPRIELTHAAALELIDP